MMIGDLKSESSGACLLLSVPEDVFAVISRSLSPSDICNLTLCCKSLCDLVDSEKIWLLQCEVLKVLPLSELVQWRVGISSYKALCRFLVEVMKPLVGIWVHQNPELGNVVYVMPGFLSVVGCRIIPQEVGPLGIEEGRVMWSPVFEIICGFDGSTGFFLHGRDREGSCLYPGFVTGIEKSCNVLLLEVVPRGEKKEGSRDVPFWKLDFSDRRKLLDIVTSRVGLHVVEPLSGRLFPCLNDDEAMLLERRTMLLKMHKFGGNWKHKNLEEEQLCYNPLQVDINEMWKNLDDDIDDSSEIKLSNRQSFLNSGDTFGIGLKASYNEMSSYQGWPIMPEERFALYKLPIKNPLDNQLYAGLWGATFGWPPGKCIEDKPDKALYLLMLTYKESQENSDERLLIGTKILEGTHYVDHPNGSAMFVANIKSPSLEPFPFDADGKNFEHSYTGEGIADGYGFRYPGSKPGSLFVISNDLLAFVWQETKDVLTLQRLNLEEILKKGLGSCLPPLRPTKNFTYLERSYINVFTNSSSYSSSSE
ncbi:unnamed protein product [Arabis nemorensis]|uniref:F-box domain-containing protein n=1 Tax=Arabis nemorensis TaxID=586526 RepID=A0A565C6S1_9BRAS|nr:unnamed protein product [Arabis nemorensis]